MSSGALNLIGRLRDRAALLSRSAQVLLVTILTVLASFALLWLGNQIALYVWARSYVDQIAAVFDINAHLANALGWIAFAVMVVLASYAFSLNRTKRIIGLSGLLGVFVAQGVVLWLGTSKSFFDRQGAAIKCYVVTRDTIRYGERPGIDPATGRPCRPITAEIAERVQAYATGAKPQRIVTAEPTFFSPRTGEPITWYVRDAQGEVELFDLMGFHPATGEELQPVSKDVASSWKQQFAEKQKNSSRQAPQRVDLSKYSPFDPITGKARVWYRSAGEEGYEFYDRDGYDPSSGERLALITPEIVGDWRKKESNRNSQRCYVITREAVLYGQTPGPDPNTGRQCRLITPELLVRLREYENGKRPERVEAANPTFFDLRNGEPILWYQKQQSGDVELFNLMGFHPLTGDELLPVTKEIAAIWKDQVERKRNRKIPERVDISKYAPFDPMTGNPRVWYWQSPKGEYEFYDSDGFHPGTGDKLQVLTKETIERSLAEARAVERKRQEEQAERARAERERAEREEKERRERADRENIERREREEREKKATQVARICDQLAGNPTDPRRASEGASYQALRGQAKEAIEACESAVRQAPSELRFQYQLARAIQSLDRPRAFEMQKKLVQQRYPAAFDNAGWLYITQENNYFEAIRLFRAGIQLGDPDCMVSLAELVEKGRATPQDFSESPIMLYQRAAQLGHAGAARAAQAEEEKVSRAEQERARKEEEARRMIELFGAVMQGISRR